MGRLVVGNRGESEVGKWGAADSCCRGSQGAAWVIRLNYTTGSTLVGPAEQYSRHPRSWCPFSPEFMRLALGEMSEVFL